MTTADFITELKSRGFTGFTETILVQYLNWGGRFIAGKTRAWWEKTTWNISLDPGQYGVLLENLPGVKTVDHIYCTTNAQRRKLAVVKDDVFYTQWAPLDLTAAASQGEPSGYYIEDGQVIILPPPQAHRDFVIHGHRKWIDLDVNLPNDSPQTPIELDEAILLATLVRCHTRAQEPDAAAGARAQLEELFGIIADEEEMLMEERQERTEPDNKWL